MEGESAEMMLKMNVQRREVFWPQFIILKQITFFLVFLKLGLILVVCMKMDNGHGQMDLHGIMRIGELGTQQILQC